MLTVKNMYDYTKAGNVKLLSTFQADFWTDYITNYDKYDRLFYRLYRSFKYFLQEDGETTEEVVNSFVEDVYTHLLVNQKKYSELYRINVISDENYSLTDNYNMTETMDRDTSNSKGARTDSTTADEGAQIITNTGTTSPYDSENFFNEKSNSQNAGARHDAGSFISGAQSDSATEDYTLTRVGNIGTMTATDMLDKHKKFWTMFEFYSYIFGEIAKELLII